jgi:hypothetical protein
MTNEKASYAKLNDGSWGVRIPDGANCVIGGNISTGAVVNVTTKAGERRMETIKSVVFAGNGVTLCAIMPREKDNSRGYRDDRSAYEKRHQIGF